MNRDEWVRHLRERYPNPVKTPESALTPPTSYCVGGALALELGLSVIHHTCGHSAMRPVVERGRLSASLSQEGPAPDCNCTLEVGFFPGTPLLAEVLCMANHDLTPEVALDFAKLIARKNDTGNFETAWAVLADALGWAPEGAWTAADDASVDGFLTAVAK